MNIGVPNPVGCVRCDFEVDTDCDTTVPETKGTKGGVGTLR